MLAGKGFEITAMSISLLVVLGSYLLICRRDRSWVTWASSIFLFVCAAEYIFPFALFLTSGPAGSHYAYGYCYFTYALSSLTLAVVYVNVKSRPFVPSSMRPAPEIGMLPWGLLAIGILLYLPIIIKFRADLLHPRDIYTETRTGYGPLYFLSSTFADLSLVAYLFKRRKNIVGSVIFYAACGALMYLHGSKGQLLAPVEIAVLYVVYVKHKRISFWGAVLATLLFVSIAMAAFAATANLSDVSEILEHMENYSDYTRNAMMVIDDPESRRYIGQLTLEAELYARVPRALMPDKPKDFGMFKLARIYFPGSYRSDEGTPDFNIGMQYADFGPFAFLYICACSALSGWVLRIVVDFLNVMPHPSIFLLLLLYANLSVYSVASGFPLPETLAIGAAIALAIKFRVLPAQFPRFQWFRQKPS
jgi:O-antigen polymerase